MARLAGPITSENAWTLRKAVTTLAIVPQTVSLTRAARMAYNVMVFKGQRMTPDADGGFTAPLSEIVKGFGGTTRESARIRDYIIQMCGNVVRWFPLSASDGEQHPNEQGLIEGVEPAPVSQDGDGRVFSLLSEARWSKRSGEQWVTWYFPPTIREMLIDPTRWAQFDIMEQAKLSHYAGVVLYEICSRYKDVPGGLTNRADPTWWTQVLRSDPDTKGREWRKFKNETVKPALAEISQRTSLEIELIEHKKGRAVTEIQFAVRRKPSTAAVDRADIAVVERAAQLGIRERDLDALIDAHGETHVGLALDNMEGRLRAAPQSPITNRLAYLRKVLRNGVVAAIFGAPETARSVDTEHYLDEVREDTRQQLRSRREAQAKTEAREDWLKQRTQQINDELEALPPEELDRLAEIAKSGLDLGLSVHQALFQRFERKQYRSPLIIPRMRDAYAREKYGPAWNVAPAEGETSYAHEQAPDAN